MDLIKTIEENAEVEDFSDDSDAEVEVNKDACIRQKKYSSKTSMLRSNIFHFTLTTNIFVFFSIFASMFLYKFP